MLNFESNPVSKKTLVAPHRGGVDFGDGCLHSLFEAQADKSPDSPALISPAATLSYAELERITNQMAHYLRAQGAGPGTFVGIYMDRGSLPIVAILGALKAGATYVPIDPAFPADRIRHIAEETSLCLLLTEFSLAERTRDFYQGTVLALDVVTDEVARHPHRRMSLEESGASPSEIAYLIYTSGTTGRPKGVMAEHRHAYRYALAFNEPCGTGPSDKVYQGFSLGFDGSVEEIWMAFSNGSALVVPGKDTPKFGAELGSFLERMEVTYFSTVPTLLSTIPDSIPSLRTLVLSGEICPAELVNRWAHAPLKMWNVYGPTEGTVNTTAFLCEPGKPVTIGKPLRGYDIHILDENFAPVKHGESGELFVGGKTLARGYLKRPDLTAEKFLVLPELKGESDVRVYRTGDLVRWNAQNELEFFGRIDSQVKIRGYRVELAEIESVLLEHPNIRTAAVKLVTKDGLQELAAYVVAADPAVAIDRNELLATMELRLPPYMLPGFLDVLPDFPLLASGKTDRNRLPEPVNPLVREKGEYIAPTSETEEKVAAVWAEAFNMKQVSVEDNFFQDLGGHSLLAARMVTSLRKAGSQFVAIRDVYTYPTVRKLAQYLDSVKALQKASSLSVPTQKKTSSEVFESESKTSYPIVAAAQAISAFPLYALHFLPLAVMMTAEIYWFNGALSGPAFWALTALITLLTWPTLLTLNLAAKWLLIGRYKPGKHRLWGAYYFRWWLANRIQVLCRLDVLAGTPLMSGYARLMGAKVGRGVIIDTFQICSWDLLSIGHNSSVGMDSQLLGYRVEDGYLTIGAIEIGNDCFVGIHSNLGLHTRMENFSALDDQSHLPDGTVIPAGEHRRGSPAQKMHVSLPEVSEPEARRSNKLIALGHLALIFVMEAVLSLPLLAALAANTMVFHKYGTLAGLAWAVAYVPVGFVIYALWFVAVKRLVLNKAEPGTYSVNSAFYLRKWFVDRLLKMSRLYLLPLYTTIYLPHWMRLLGAKIGKRAELSVLAYFSPDLIELGEESFFADSSIIGGKRFYRRHFQIAMNKIGRRSFVGNASVLPVGASLGDGCLLGVTSLPASRHTPDGTDWVGSPAFSLPSRQKVGVGKFSEEEIFRPTASLVALRCLIDGLRVLIPSYGLFAGAYGMYLGMKLALSAFGFTGMVLSVPALGTLIALWYVAVTAVTKWIFMGVIKPEVKPLWSHYVWRNEMVNGVFESTMSPALLPLHGTPFVGPLLRTIGCKIGRRCYIESTLFSEFDLVNVGDYVALNRGSIVQNHLFEDRVMKSSTVDIESDCSVGNMAVVLYDTEMKKGANIGPLSLLMKGESMKPRSHWHGIPTVQISAGEEEPASNILPFPAKAGS